MADLTTKDRLQPSLLDRLADDEPDKLQESRDRRVLSWRKLRESVTRDLSWLFNTVNLAASRDLSGFPEIQTSVLNYGMPDLAGRTSSTVDSRELERLLTAVIKTYEPRILANTLSIKIHGDRESMTHNALIFDIEGELWGEPVPTQIFLKTELDLEIGAVQVTDAGAPDRG